jgi:hypothetical protein
MDVRNIVARCATDTEAGPARIARVSEEMYPGEGVSVRAVYQWCDRNTIPDKYWEVIRRLVDITIFQLYEINRQTREDDRRNRSVVDAMCTSGQN